MNRKIFQLIATSVAVGFFSVSIQAATIWTGEDITITQPDDSPTTVVDDLITGVASLTRGNNGPLCNMLAGDTCSNSNDIPSDFEFAFSELNFNPVINYGDASKFADLSFAKLAVSLESNIGSMTPRVGVAHHLSTDAYFDIELTHWEQGGGGGFSYRRSTPAVPEPSSLALALVALAFGASFVRSARRGKI